MGLFKFLLNVIIKPVIIFFFKLYYKNVDKTKPLPPVKNELLMLPAHELARRIRNREVECFLFIFFKQKWLSIL